MRQMNKDWEKASQAASDVIAVFQKTLSELQYANEILKTVLDQKEETIQELQLDCKTIREQISDNNRIVDKIIDILN